MRKILTVRIPDDLAKRLGASGADLEGKALKASEVLEAPRFETLDEMDGFLKTHAVYEPCSDCPGSAYLVLIGLPLDHRAGRVPTQIGRSASAMEGDENGQEDYPRGRADPNT
jgi:hypothetical protein